MENKTNESVWRIIAIGALAMMTVVSCLYAKTINENKQPAPVPEVEPAKEDWLTLWNDDAKAKQELTAYIEAVTDENGPDFIPVENRVAVFDLDGTLFCETDPVYFDHMLFMHRVQDDPDH